MQKKLFFLFIAAAIVLDTFAFVHGYTKHFSKPRVLVVGFEPFGGRSENASWEAIQNWENRRETHAFSYHTLKLPVDDKKAASLLTSAIQDWKPNIILLFSEHPTANTVRIETTARGKDGTLLETRLPTENLKDAYEAAGIKSVLSDNAGSFVSNNTFYSLMKFLIDTKQDEVIAGAIHLPLPTEKGFSKEILGNTVAITLKTLTN